jgi:hypothetical protein
MSDLEIIEEIKKLPDDKKARVIDFVRSLRLDGWDQEIIDDVTGGRLDEIAREAIEEHRAGRTTPFPSDAE